MNGRVGACSWWGEYSDGWVEGASVDAETAHAAERTSVNHARVHALGGA